MKNEYQKMLSQIKPDEKLAEKTLQQFAGSEKVRVHKRHRAWKPAAVVAGILAFAIAFPFLQSTGTHVTSSAGGQKPSAVATQNSFGLAVYAADKTHSGNTVTLQMKPDLSQYSSSNNTLGNYFDCLYQPNLQCAGSNLKTVQYSLDASALGSDEQAFFVRTDEDALPDMGAKQREKSNPFTINYQRKNISEQMSQYGLYVTEKLTDAEFKERRQQYDAYTEKEQAACKKLQPLPATEDDYPVQQSIRMAQILSKARVVLKATFLDGNVQTHTYQIVPKEDYNKNLVAAYKFVNQLEIEYVKKFPAHQDIHYSEKEPSPEEKKFTEQAEKRATAFINQHPLFNITQIGAAPSQSKNSFNLTAYATDNKNIVGKEKDNKIAFGDLGEGFGPLPNRGARPEKPDEYGQYPGAYTGCSLNVTGNNIKEIHFQMSKGKLYSSIKKMGFDSKYKTSYSYYKMLGSDFTVPYNSNEKYGFYMDRETILRAYGPDAKTQQQAMDAMDLRESSHKDIDRFAGVTLKITVTYMDGSKASKTLNLKTGALKYVDKTDDKGNQYDVVFPELVTDRTQPYVYSVYADIT